MAPPAGSDETGGPWRARGSGFRCCWRQRSPAGPRPCGPGRSTSRPPSPTTPSSRTTSSSGTTPVRPRSPAAPSSTRPSSATATSSSAPARGNLLNPQVSRTCPAAVPAPREPARGHLPKPPETPSFWLLPNPVVGSQPSGLHFLLRLFPSCRRSLPHVQSPAPFSASLSGLLEPGVLRNPAPRALFRHQCLLQDCSAVRISSC